MEASSARVSDIVTQSCQIAFIQGSELQISTQMIRAIEVKNTPVYKNAPLLLPDLF